MASLPPKPLESSPRDKTDSRYPPDDRDKRSTRSVVQTGSRYRGDRISENDRVYVPRTRTPDSYVASAYESRRDHDSRRRDYPSNERDRDRWERRDRGTRFEPDPDYDRYRRNSRERVPERHFSPRNRYRDSYDHSRRDPRPSPPRRDYHRRSRSPQRRRPTSPGPSYRGRAMSRHRSHSPPPPKRMKLGNHSIEASPYYDDAHYSPLRQPPSTRRSYTPPGRSLSKSSPHNKHNKTPQDTTVVKDEKPHAAQHDVADAMEMPTDRPSLIHDSAPTPRGPLAGKRVDSKEVLNVATRQSTEDNVKMRERSPSPPRQPRSKGTQPPAPTNNRHTSRSPPRGPRSHIRGNVTPTGPTSLPTGPRGQRRQYPNSTSLPTNSASQTVAQPTPTEERLTPSLDSEGKHPHLAIPQCELGPSLTRDLDLEMARLQAHRAHLASEYAQNSKGTRRALHELEMATIDLRAAENRRKIADNQMEKARAGMLGIDATLIDTPVV